MRLGHSLRQGKCAFSGIAPSARFEAENGQFSGILASCGTGDASTLLCGCGMPAEWQPASVATLSLGMGLITSHVLPMHPACFQQSA